MLELRAFIGTGKSGKGGRTLRELDVRSLWLTGVLSLLVLVGSCLPLYATPPAVPTAETLRIQTPSSDAEEIVVTGEGMAAYSGDIAAAQEEAVWDAKRNAVEQAVGIFLKSHTVGSGFQLEDDEIHGRTEGFVRRWEIVEGSRRIEKVPLGAQSTGAGKAKGQILHIEVKATVGLLKLVKRLADIADVYKDMERPRVRVAILPGAVAHKPASKDAIDAAERVQTEMAGALRAQGFDVASDGAAEIVLKGTLDVVPTVRLGDRSAPYGIGDTVAVCRASMTLQAVSTASEDVLFVRRAEATGRSFESDGDALHSASTQLATTAIEDNSVQFIPHLLVRWAHERQEGHVVVIRATGMTGAQSNRLRDLLETMRGFRRFVEQSAQTNVRNMWRFLTRRDTRSVRRDLAEFDLGGATSGSTSHKLVVMNDRGPIIDCAVRVFASASASHH